MFVSYPETSGNISLTAIKVSIDVNLAEKKAKSPYDVLLYEQFAYDQEEFRYVSSYLPMDSEFEIKNTTVGLYEGEQFVRFMGSPTEILIIPSAFVPSYTNQNKVTIKDVSLVKFTKKPLEEVIVGDKDKRSLEHFIKINNDFNDGHSEFSIPLSLFIQHDMVISNTITQSECVFTLELSIKPILNEIKEKRANTLFLITVNDYLVMFNMFKSLPAYKIAWKDYKNIPKLEELIVKLQPEITHLSKVFNTIVQLLKSVAQFRVKTISPTHLFSTVAKRLTNLSKLCAAFKMKLRYNFDNVFTIIPEISSLIPELNFDTFQSLCGLLIKACTTNEIVSNLNADAESIASIRATSLSTDFISIKGILSMFAPILSVNYSISEVVPGIRYDNLLKAYNEAMKQEEAIEIDQNRISNEQIRGTLKTAINAYAISLRERSALAQKVYDAAARLGSKASDEVKKQGELSAKAIADISKSQKYVAKLIKRMKMVKSFKELWALIKEESEKPADDRVISAIFRDNIKNNAKAKSKLPVRRPLKKRKKRSDESTNYDQIEEVNSKKGSEDDLNEDLESSEDEFRII